VRPEKTITRGLGERFEEYEVKSIIPKRRGGGSGVQGEGGEGGSGPRGSRGRAREREPPDNTRGKKRNHGRGGKRKASLPHTGGGGGLRSEVCLSASGARWRRGAYWR